MGFFNKLFDKLFGKKKEEEAAPENLLGLARQIEPVLEKTTSEIFQKYHESLLQEDITYIVFAVWGARNDGPLTDIQKEINKIVLPALKSIVDIFNIEGVSADRKYAIEYLIRGLIISKTTYNIEFIKRQAEIKKNQTGDNKTSDDNIITPYNDLFSSFFDQENNVWKRRFGEDPDKRW